MKTRIKFIEDSPFFRGRPIISVVAIQDGKWINIGGIYSNYNPEMKKYNYRATDSFGNKIFIDAKGLTELKEQFRKCGESLVQTKQMVIQDTKIPVQIVNKPNPERNKELKVIREKKSEKEKTKEVSKANPKAITNEAQKEKEQDSKNPVKYRDNELNKSKKDSQKNTIDKSKFNEAELDDQLAEEGRRYEEEMRAEAKIVSEIASEIEQEQIQEYYENNEQENEISAREDELNQIREDNEDREQELDMDR